MDKVDTTELEKVKQLLRDIQLDQFYRQINGKLHITRLSHFDHVTEEDLDDLGMAKPEQRRLFEALKKAKKKSLFNSFRRKKTKKGGSHPDASVDRTSCYGVATNSLTCLISEQSLTLYEMLGNGAFGYVRRGKWVKDSRKKLNVAVKCLKAWNDQAFQQMQMEFIKEANAMSLLDHPHIIRLHGIVLSVPMMLVTELALLGCLLTRLRDEPHNFTISGLSDFVVQIASGMAYLESHRFVHRDLAARNLLLESYEKVKIGDFGMMRVLSEDDDHYTMHPSGKIPFAWCPQEVLKFRKFSHASDVWAFGITVLELFSYGVEPWPGLNGAEVLDKVDMPLCERPKKPDHCPPEIYKILTAHCWAHEPHQRARFSVLKKTMDEARPVNAAAIFPYESKCQENLCFKAGDIITLLDASPDVSWWKGQNMRTREVGMFPSELVDSGLRRAVSPVSRWTSPKQRSSSKQPSWKCNLGTNCDCGSAHIYETPIFLDSADLFSTSSKGSSSRSSRSVESDLMSSIEVDSGYSSSIDVRRFNTMNGKNSPEQQENVLGASYENTTFAVQSAKGRAAEYELMLPAFKNGPVSNPIDIPKPGSEDLRYTRGERIVPVTPVLSEDKCPLDFSNFHNSQFSPGKVASTCTSPVAAKTSTSLPSNSVTQTSPQEPRLSKTASPPRSKKTSLDSGVGGSFGEEVLSFLKESDTQKSSDGSSGTPEEDIYVELSRPAVGAVGDPSGSRSNSSSSRNSLKAHYENSYENHCFPLMSKSQKEQGNLDSGYDRIKCRTDYQAQSDELRDVRSNTWPVQQNYDNHKLRDVNRESSSQSHCYDNHNLRSLERSLSPRDVYDNWKIKNGACDVNGESKLSSIYDNVKLSNRKEISQETATSKPEKVTSSTNVAHLRQMYENCFPKSADSAYENFTPKHLRDDSGKSGQGVLGKMSSENHSAEGLSSSLPENCFCVDLIPGDRDSMSMIVEKRSPLALAGARKCSSFIERTDRPSIVDKDDLDHPVPPPRWKRIARLSHPQSQVGSSEEKWSVSLNPEIASALRKRYNATVDSTSVAASAAAAAAAAADVPQAQPSESKKPALPPHVKENGVEGTLAHPTLAANTYENVVLRSKIGTEEASSTCPPELPPKKKQSTEGDNRGRNNGRTRALHYENVDVVKGFHAEKNAVLASDLEDGIPPPLPRKTSEKKENLCGSVPG